MNRLLGVRPEDGRVVWMAFATLLTIVAAHAVLETARDALFLADLPASRLPWAYLGIASLAFVLTRGAARVLAGRSHRRILAAMLVAGAVGTAALWWLVVTPTTLSLMSLYIWTGVLASIVVTQFWIQLAGEMDVAQAKRGYAIVAAGGMLGATVGSFLAGAALTAAEPRTLLPLAAGMFLAAACLPAFVQRPASPATASPAADPAAAVPDAEERPGLAAVWGDPYLKRILLLAVVAPVVAMGIDFIFKSMVSQQVPRARLGPFFARYNTVVNGAALVFQLTLAPRLLQSLGVVRNLCLLPSALGLVAAGVAGTASLPAALVLRGTDGVLRHSLHRAATEILFLPISAATRSALRGLAESIGQRGGQLLGSTLILLAIAAGATPRELAVGVAILCGVWLVGSIELKDHYVQRFRRQLRSLGAEGDAGVPALDLQSLELLVTTLSAPNDTEVIAGLDLLATYGRVRLVSPLILYHPSSSVVLRALELFDGDEREDVQEIRRRLLQHGDAMVRATALRGLAPSGRERSAVRDLLRHDPSPLVRSTALALWMGFDGTPESDVNEAVADLVALSDPESRLAVAGTLGRCWSRRRPRSAARSRARSRPAPTKAASRC
jgi:ATP:ADP antiporter, AAA family